MAVDLEISNSFLFEPQGRSLTGKQGAATATLETPETISVTGQIHNIISTLATGAGLTVWDEDDDNPTDWNYLYFWSDQDCFLQLIGQTCQISLPIKALVPHTQYGDQLLAAVNTTPLAAAPTLEDIDSVRIWNQSGNTMNFHLAIIN